MISSKQALLLLTGVSAGAAAAILFAPQSGATTRKAIDDGVSGAGRKVTDAGEYLRSQAERWNKDAQAALRQTSAQVENVLTEASKSVTQTLNDANRAFAENLERASTAIAAAARTFNVD